MRPDADHERLDAFLRALAREVREPHVVYLVGGASALVEAWRDSTIDLDLLPEPDSDDVLRAIATLKDRVDVNVELASPLDFLPPLRGWRERSPFVANHGSLTVRHLDFRLQALAKLERGLAQDRADVAAMLERELVTADELRAGLEEMRPSLFRFPAVDEARFAQRLEDALR